MAENTQDLLNRRNFFQMLALGTAGTLVGAQTVLSETCRRDESGAQPLGPFFPKDGSPERPVRENPNPSIPIYLANDQDLTQIKGVSTKAQGQIVYLKGKVMNRRCEPIQNATIIIWQASKSGRYNHLSDGSDESFRHPKTGEIIERQLDPGFQYWGRAITDLNGEYWFKTIVPGFYPADLNAGWYRPPHIHFLVSATGYPQLVTQMYFQGSQIIDEDWIRELNRKDYLLQTRDLSEEERLQLIVNFKKEVFRGERQLVGNFDLTLKG